MRILPLHIATVHRTDRNGSDSALRTGTVVATALMCQLLCLSASAMAQQINFSLTVDEGIIAEGIEPLDFNEKQAVINNGDVVSVDLITGDFHALGAIEIIAATAYEIDVIIDFPENLMPPEQRFDQIQKVPVTYRWAYNNTSASSCNETALENSELVPEGFSMARMAVRPWTGVTPGLPPEPMHGGIQTPDGNPGGDEFRREAALICLFIGGTITVPNVPSDDYSSDVSIEIRYSSPLTSK